MSTEGEEYQFEGLEHILQESQGEIPKTKERNSYLCIRGIENTEYILKRNSQGHTIGEAQNKNKKGY